MIINLNLNNSIHKYKVEKGTKYKDIANIIYDKLGDNKLEIRSTDDCNVHILKDYIVSRNGKEVRGDVLYIR